MRIIIVSPFKSSWAELEAQMEKVALTKTQPSINHVKNVNSNTELQRWVGGSGQELSLPVELALRC